MKESPGSEADVGHTLGGEGLRVEHPL